MKVLVKFLTGEEKKGDIMFFNVSNPTFPLQIEKEDGTSEMHTVTIDSVKAIYFLKREEFSKTFLRRETIEQTRYAGTVTFKLMVEFKDGEVLHGTTLKYNPNDNRCFTLGHLQSGGLQLSPFIERIQDVLNSLEKNKTDAFPSGHTAVALMSLYYAWKEREHIFFAVLVPVVTGLIIATVYLRYHYVIDVIAGIAVTGLTIALAPRLRRLLTVGTRLSGR